MKAATEMTTAEIRDELKKLNSVLDEHEAARRDPDYEGHGGSPGEGMYERHEELSVELRRRKDKLLVWARQYDIAYFDEQPEDEVARLRAEVAQLRALLREIVEAEVIRHADHCAVTYPPISAKCDCGIAEVAAKINATLTEAMSS